MVAGHLLLRLLRNFALNFRIIGSSPALIILSLLEIGVAIIQAYVFTTLINKFLLLIIFFLSEKIITLGIKIANHDKEKNEEEGSNIENKLFIIFKLKP